LCRVVRNQEISDLASCLLAKTRLNTLHRDRPGNIWETSAALLGHLDTDVEVLVRPTFAPPPQVGPLNRGLLLLYFRQPVSLDRGDATCAWGRAVA
jgi:hypothetical protein